MYCVWYSFISLIFIGLVIQNISARRVVKKQFQVVHQIHINDSMELPMSMGKRDGKAILISACFNRTVLKCLL